MRSLPDRACFAFGQSLVCDDSQWRTVLKHATGLSEFVMAEIEHYVDPLDKSHYRFDEVRDQKLMLLAKDVQEAGRTDLQEMSIGDAVDNVGCACLNI